MATNELYNELDKLMEDKSELCMLLIKSLAVTSLHLKDKVDWLEQQLDQIVQNENSHAMFIEKRLKNVEKFIAGETSSLTFDHDRKEEEKKGTEPGKPLPQKTVRTVLCGGCGDTHFKDLDAIMEHECPAKRKTSNAPLPQEAGTEEGEGGTYFKYPAEFAPTTDLPKEDDPHNIFRSIDKLVDEKYPKNEGFPIL